MVLIVTLFSNSSLGVSGPAAGLVAIVAPAIVQLGFGNFLLAVVLSGVIQFLLGLLKAGTIGYYFPTSVIKGNVGCDRSDYHPQANSARLRGRQSSGGSYKF